MQSHAESFKKIIKKSVFDHLFFKVTHFSPKPSFLTSRQPCLIKNNVLQVSGPDTLENAIKITSKSKFSIYFVQIPSHLHPALSYSLTCEITEGTALCAIPNVDRCAVPRLGATVKNYPHRQRLRRVSRRVPRVERRAACRSSNVLPRPPYAAWSIARRAPNTA